MRLVARGGAALEVERVGDAHRSDGLRCLGAGLLVRRVGLAQQRGGLRRGLELIGR